MSLNIQEQVRLAPFCTYQIGGPADYFVEATSAEQVVEALEWAREHDQKVFVFGGGSNLLFDDAGFRGLVIRMRNSELRVEGDEIFAEAGAKMAVVVEAAKKAGLTGLEAWTGLPGTVGGAVAGNAGCFGVETADVLKEARVWFADAGVQTLRGEDMGYAYRTSILKQRFGVVLDARFELKPGDASEIETRMKEIAKTRIGKQPPGLSTGSFFKNHSVEQTAGMLIDQCGLKGFKIGGAKVSEHHANFLMNAGKATAKDFLALSEHIQKCVMDRFGIELKREVVFVAAQ